MMTKMMLRRANYTCISTFIGSVQCDAQINETLSRRCLLDDPVFKTACFVRPREWAGDTNLIYETDFN